MKYDKEYCGKAADYLRELVPYTPEIGVVLGSGLGPLAKSIKDPIEVPYTSIPNFLRSTVSSHAGKMIFGETPDYKPGDIMVIKDHIKLNGASPLRGPNADEFGPRFFDVTNMYTKSLRELALKLAEKSELTFHEGVYYFTTGPQFETPAEIRAIQILGGDSVGMSTVTEAITAAHCSMNLLGFSVISNMAAGVKNEALTTEEVDDVTEAIAEPFSKYIADVIEHL